jgi:hypothetical protein
MVYKPYFCQDIVNCLRSSCSCVTILITDLNFVLSFIEILALSLSGSRNSFNVVRYFHIKYYRLIMLGYDLEVAPNISQQ